jgi:hypothetical protein
MKKPCWFGRRGSIEMNDWNSNDTIQLLWISPKFLPRYASRKRSPGTNANFRALNADNFRGCTMPKPMTFKAVHTAMTQYRERIAPPGGKCDAWTDFAEHSRWQLGQLPRDLPGSLSVSRQFADYWLAVADGSSPDYDAATGAWIDRAAAYNDKSPAG